MGKTFDGKVALVTGAATGIGRATAFAFAREGARVVVADVATEAALETVRTIEERGGTALFVRTDVSSARDVESMVATAVKTYGRLDCAFNNAGIIGDTGLRMADLSEENWDRVIGVNLRGVWLCMKYEILHMLEHGGGAIVNTASAAGLKGGPRFAAYTASKHGVVGASKAAALEYVRSGIRVNVICPGVVRTQLADQMAGEDPKNFEAMIAGQPIGRIGEPEELAEVALWLCSPAASFVTGVTLPVDGAFMALR